MKKTWDFWGLHLKYKLVNIFYNIVHCHLFQNSLHFTGRNADISLKRENEANKENTADDDLGVSKSLMILCEISKLVLVSFKLQGDAIFHV